ncbi:MAG: glutamate 5-kinase [Phycisphaerales bacterium]
MQPEAPTVTSSIESNAPRVVIKIGSGVLAPNGELSLPTLQRICDDVMRVTRMGYAPILVSSGTIACGRLKLGLEQMPRALHLAQASAAIGQPVLMHAYQQAFQIHDQTIAQVLLTADDFSHRRRYLNALRTLDTLIEAGIIPIINENDSILFDEIRVGDNDTLASLIGSAIRAQHAVIISVAGGVRHASKDEVITELGRVADALPHVNDEQSSSGTGGMGSKLNAVETLLAHGIETSIVPGPNDEVVDPVSRCLSGQDIGTRFTIEDLANIPSARKSWLAHGCKPQGVLWVDSGAERALRDQGASLLAKGVTKVRGDFTNQQLVEIRNPEGEVFARGLSAYSAREIDQIMGQRSAKFEDILGYHIGDEVIHRQDLVILSQTAIA